jgi:FtsH-binding integral membrane protein
MQIIQRALALAAALFGLVTIVAGTRVLLGADPGYVVFRPLLIYNSIMGVVYVGAGIIAWRSLNQGMYVAAGIFALNLFVLVGIYFLYTAGSSVAVDSLRAMSFRTIVWFALFAGLGWLWRRDKLCRLTPEA